MRLSCAGLRWVALGPEAASQPRPLRTAQEPPKSHRRPLRTAQEAAKSLPGAAQRPQELIRRPRGGPGRLQKPAKTLYCRRFSAFRQNAALGPPRAPQEPPGGTQEHSKSPSEPPKSGLRELKRRQEHPKGGAKGPPEGSTSGPDAARRPQGHQEVQKDSPRGHNLTKMLSEITGQKIFRHHRRPNPQDDMSNLLQ